eukprot:scaffold15284_cov74-Cyclotella_meneghiniana.AAC.1
MTNDVSFFIREWEEKSEKDDRRVSSSEVCRSQEKVPISEFFYGSELLLLSKIFHSEQREGPNSTF